MFSYSLSLSLFYLYWSVSLSVSLSLCVCNFFSYTLPTYIFISLCGPLFLSLYPFLSHSHLCHPTYLASNISVSLYPNLTIFCILLYLTYYFQLSLFHTASPSLCLFFSLVLFIGSFRVQIRK